MLVVTSRSPRVGVLKYYGATTLCVVMWTERLRWGRECFTADSVSVYAGLVPEYNPAVMGIIYTRGQSRTPQ